MFLQIAVTFPKKSRNKRTVYLDHAAATPLDRSAFAAMRPYLTQEFANPSGLSVASLRVRKAIDEARKSVANVLRVPDDTIVFTGSGTESCNLAIFGVCTGRPKHIITTSIEHHAVLEPIKKLEKKGWKVTYLKVNERGEVSAQNVKKALRKDTALVSIMYANNEIGTIQPIAKIGRELLKSRKECKTPYPYFHTDACQAAGYLDLSVDRLHVDFLSANGGKIYGPKGVGILYKRRGVPLEPLLYGGGHESGFRSGTENVAGIVGFAKALQSVNKKSRIKNQELTELKDYLEKEIIKKITDVTVNGSEKNRLPNNLSVTFRGVEAEALILYLDSYGIVAASGAACASVTDETSHVLRACGLSDADARATARFTLGRETKKEDIQYVMRYLPPSVRELRKISEKSDI